MQAWIVWFALGRCWQRSAQVTAFVSIIMFLMLLAFVVKKFDGPCILALLQDLSLTHILPTVVVAEI